MKTSIYAFLLLFSSSLAAAGAGSPVRLDIAKGDIGAQRAAIAGAVDGKEFSEIGDGNRAELFRLLEQIERSPGAVEQNRKHQDRANAILDAAFADSRLICRQVKEISSNVSKRSCMTMAAKRRAAESGKLDSSSQIKTF